MKLTENLVAFHDGDNRQVFVDKVALDGSQLTDRTKGTKRKAILVDDMAYSSTRRIYDPNECYTPDLSTVEGISQYLTGFNNLPCHARVGYDAFVNENGATNPESPKKFKPEATFRILLAYFEALNIKVAQGDTKAIAYLVALSQFAKVATEKATALLAHLKENAKKTTLADTAQSLGVPADELAAFLAQRNAARAAAAAAAVTVTVADTVAEDTDTDTVAEDTEPVYSEEGAV